MNPMALAMMSQSAAQVMTPFMTGLGMDMASPAGSATSGLNVFDFGNWTVSTGSSRADATNTETKPSSGQVGGLDLNLIVVALVAVVIIKRMG